MLLWRFVSWLLAPQSDVFVLARNCPQPVRYSWNFRDCRQVSQNVHRSFSRRSQRKSYAACSDGTLQGSTNAFLSGDLGAKYRGDERVGATNQAWAAIASDPVLSKFFEDQSCLHKTLGEIQALYKPAAEGHRGEALSFDMKVKAATLSAALTRLSDPAVLFAMKERLGQLQKLSNETLGETKQRADQLIRGIQQTLALVDPDYAERTRAEVDQHAKLKHLIETIRSPKFSPSADEKFSNRCSSRTKAVIPWTIVLQ